MHTLTGLLTEKKLVFASFSNANGTLAEEANIFVINADGTGLRQLTSSKYEDNDPEWSPDGTMIAFKSTRNTKKNAREEIYVMNSGKQYEKTYYNLWLAIRP